MDRFGIICDVVINELYEGNCLMLVYVILLIVLATLFNHTYLALSIYTIIEVVNTFKVKPRCLI